MDKHTFFSLKIKMMDLWMQIEGSKLIFVMNFSVLDFFKFGSRNASDCTDFSLDFQNFSNGACHLNPHWYFLVFFALAIPGCVFKNSEY